MSHVRTRIKHTALLLPHGEKQVYIICITTKNATPLFFEKEQVFPTVFVNSTGCSVFSVHSRVAGVLPPLSPFLREDRSPLRSTAMSSATTEMAISSGVSARMGRPTGW